MTTTCAVCNGLGQTSMNHGHSGHVHAEGHGGCMSVHRSRQPLLVTTSQNEQTINLDITAAKNWMIEAEFETVNLKWVNLSKSGRRGTVVIQNDRNDGGTVTVNVENTDAIKTGETVSGAATLPITIPNLKHAVIEYYVSGPASKRVILRTFAEQ